MQTAPITAKIDMICDSELPRPLWSQLVTLPRISPQSIDSRLSMKPSGKSDWMYSLERIASMRAGTCSAILIAAWMSCGITKMHTSKITPITQTIVHPSEM